jgi:hypothetical protein
MKVSTSWSGTSKQNQAATQNPFTEKAQKDESLANGRAIVLVL